MSDENDVELLAIRRTSPAEEHLERFVLTVRAGRPYQIPCSATTLLSYQAIRALILSETGHLLRLAYVDDERGAERQKQAWLSALEEFLATGRKEQAGANA